ncbi:hypothetical protein JL108_05430 [Aeromicrobium sp. YIM 150415]|uniref:hypothetical protein n=1 Tax=Aeromicrobium sp. YIM 150415 TaxID=2803912 RepID=UPI00196572B7|nr:hypothetical protein [Aeromicrobium sp. YIM 150415]MBM9462883.1 hypothetical protein [Aeromicrobium sp. YIM 150415]
MRRGLRVAAIGLAAVLIGTVSPAFAGWDWDDDDLVGTDPGGSVTDPGGGGGGDRPIFTDPEPWMEHAYAPYCQSAGIRHDPETNRPMQINDNLCPEMYQYAETHCADGENGYWDFGRLVNPDGTFPNGPEFERLGPICRGANDPPPQEGPRQITIDDIIDSARAVAPGVEITTEPGARSYVNFPTNMYVDDADQQVNVDVLGFDIPLTFSPEDVTWNFGDGASATGAGIADAEVGQEGAVEHAYRRSGSYAIGVTVDYTVEATLPNGQTLQMPGTISGSGGPYDLGVGELQSIVKKVR